MTRYKAVLFDAFGDDWEADVLGAKGVGMRGVHLVRGDEDSPGSNAIKDLRGVIDIL